MKNAVSVVLVGSLLSLSANARVIYGEDNRVEVSEATPFQQQLARSTATMISSTQMFKDAFRKGVFHVNQAPLSSMFSTPQPEAKGVEKILSKFKDLDEVALVPSLGFCAEERFVDQPNAGMCTGFLIAEDILVTAGHCVDLENFCEEYKWVFDYKMDPETKTAGVGVTSDNIYSCKRVLSTDLSVPLNIDYGVIQLDRKVTDREPLEVRNSGKVPEGLGLVIIGSPSGLPLKVAEGANVRDNTHPFFFNANLDSYQGNSGSPVFDANTGVVEGILVRGDQDFVGNIEKKCIESNRCKNGECRGEDVSRMTSIPEIGLQKALQVAALEGDMTSLNLILSFELFVDFYTKDGVTALMKAAEGNQAEAMKFLIEKGADVNLTDREGNTLAHYLVQNLTEETQANLNLIPETQITALNKLNQTTLHTAAKKNNLFAVELLLEKGLDLNAKDKNGETILFAFARHGNEEAIARLIGRGANGQVLNNEGKTFLDLGTLNNTIIWTE